MLERLTAEEIDFMESYYDSVCMAETLFSNFDNMSAMEEDKFSHIRLGQLPLMSYEYLIDVDKNLSKKENFSLRKGAGDIYCFGGRNFGKCNSSESYCLLADGRRVQFKDLIGKKEKILSFNEDSWKLELDEALFFDNGNRNCIKIVLNSGKEDIVTLNHPLFTQKGWIEAKDLSLDDFVATPCNYGDLGKKEVDEKIALLLGYLLGDGGCTQSTINFTNINLELIKEFCDLVAYFDCSVSHRKQSFYIKNSEKNKYKQNKNLIKDLVKKYSIDCLSKNKVIPNEVFSWKNKYIALLLNRLYACDGYINKNNTIDITLASEKMIKDIQHLLLRFGIHSNIYYKTRSCNDKIFDAWELSISSYENCLRFIDKIGIKSKEHKFKRKVLQYSNSDLIPNKFYYDIEHLLVGFKKTLVTRKFKHYNVSRTKWIKLAKEIDTKIINKIAYSDIRWDKIEKIEFIKNVATVAVSVPTNHTFISNDIISHNTVVVEKLDVLLNFLLSSGDRIGFSSYDAIHIRGVLEDIIHVVENHPFFKIFESNINRSPCYRITMNGNSLESINMNLTSKQSGNQFYQKHLHKLFIEEASMETHEVYKQRRDSVSELGCVYRISGMTNFTKYSPAGQVFYDLSKRSWVSNLSQYVNPNWDERTKQQAIKDFGGEGAIGYRIFIKGEVVEEGVSVFDMQRIRNKYFEDRKIKNFEITKENYFNHESVLILERPSNADCSFVFADIGESAPTEIGVIFEINKKYRYIYNITLYNLTDKEQIKIFEFIIRAVQANFISVDCTDGLGRVIYRSLEESFGKERLVFTAFNAKIPVDFEKDDTGNILTKNGEPIYKEEYVSEWSIKHLKDLLYSDRMELPLDYKLDSQLNSVIAMQSGTRTIYSCISEEDHLFQAFQVFSIMHWYKEFELIKPVLKKSFCKSGV